MTTTQTAREGIIIDGMSLRDYRKDPNSIQRDRWGRPVVIPPDGGKPVSYTRVSTMAKELDDTFALNQWKMRQVAVGMSVRSDLVSLASAKSDDKEALDEIVEQAMAAAKSNEKANVGTALHAFCEKVDAGIDPRKIIPNVGDPFQADLLAYRDAMKGIQIEATEVFVVVDEIEAGGSFDRLVSLPTDHGYVIADIKTGQSEPRFPHAAAQQIAMYAHGTIYDDGERIASLADIGVNQEVGMMIHLPSGQGVCNLYLLDLVHGWQMAKVAFAVRKTRKFKPIESYIRA